MKVFFMSSYIRKITSVYICIAYIRQKSKNVGLNRPYETYIREEKFSSLKMKTITRRWLSFQAKDIKDIVIVVEQEWSSAIIQIFIPFSPLTPHALQHTIRTCW